LQVTGLSADFLGSSPTSGGSPPRIPNIAHRIEGYSPAMGLVLVLIVLAIAFGAIGLLVSALKWLLIIALVLFIAGLISGGRARRT